MFRRLAEAFRVFSPDTTAALLVLYLVRRQVDATVDGHLQLLVE